jgi:hypothetical protein
MMKIYARGTDAVENHLDIMELVRTNFNL